MYADFLVFKVLCPQKSGPTRIVTIVRIVFIAGVINTSNEILQQYHLVYTTNRTIQIHFMYVNNNLTASQQIMNHTGD